MYEDTPTYSRDMGDDKDDSGSLDDQVQQVLDEDIGIVANSGDTEKLNMVDFEDNDMHVFNQQPNMYEPMTHNYNPEPEVKETPGEMFKRKYSSPPASIYDDNTEDGRIRLSEGEVPQDTFTVSDPVKGGHVTYTVRGFDDDGPFEGQRRYNDFFNLRAAILRRWPGVY